MWSGFVISRYIFVSTFKISNDTIKRYVAISLSNLNLYEIFFHDQLDMYILMNKLSRKIGKNNVIWVYNATIQLCFKISDQQPYYKVLCGHIMVKTEYFSNIFIINLTNIYWLIKWAKTTWKIIWIEFVTPQYSFALKFQNWNNTMRCFVTISWSNKNLFEIFFIINFM